MCGYERVWMCGGERVCGGELCVCVCGCVEVNVCGCVEVNVCVWM